MLDQLAAVRSAEFEATRAAARAGKCGPPTAARRRVQWARDRRDRAVRAARLARFASAN